MMASHNGDSARALAPGGGKRGGVAIVTGGTKGIGGAIAIGLAEAGMRVCALFASDTAAASKAGAELNRLSPSSETRQVDITDTKATRAAIDAIAKEWGRVDVLVNSAGVNRRNTFMNASEKDWDDVFDTNVRGLYFACQAAARWMIEQRSGRIVNISSIASAYAIGDRSVYEACKAAVDRITKSIAMELAPHGISVNAVSPGLVETELTLRAGAADIAQRAKAIPAGRIATPKEVADVVRFLAIDGPSYVTGVVVPIDGGRLTR